MIERLLQLMTCEIGHYAFNAEINVAGTTLLVLAVVHLIAVAHI
jgi:hypothetical protein